MRGFGSIVHVDLVRWLICAMEGIVDIVSKLVPKVERIRNLHAIQTLVSPAAKAALTGLSVMPANAESATSFEPLHQVVNVPSFVKRDSEMEVTVDYPAAAPHVVACCTQCQDLLTREETMSCARCHAVHYCSRACQAKHWKKGVLPHKKSCAIYADLMKSNSLTPLNEALLAESEKAQWAQVNNGMANACTMLSNEGLFGKGAFAVLSDATSDATEESKDPAAAVEDSPSDIDFFTFATTPSASSDSSR